MLDRSPRRMLAILALVAASAALLATSPPPPTAEAEAHGEIDVAPDDPARVEARFTVTDPGENEIVRLRAEPLVETWGDRRVSSNATVAMDERPVRFGLGNLELEPSACRDGCSVSVALDARWVGDAGPGIRTRWSVRLSVEYDFDPPQGAVSLDGLSGDDPGVPRTAWVGLGAAALLALGLVMRRVAGRLAGLRLALAGGLTLIGAWAALSSASYLWYQLGGRVVLQWEQIATGVAGTALVLAALAGIALAVRGRDALLRVTGWLALIVIGAIWWLVVEGMGTYRPHEVAGLTVLLGISPLAAIQGLVQRRMGAVAALVIACQVLMFGATVLVAGAAVIALVVSLVGQGRLPDVGTLMIGAIPVVVAIEFAVAIRLWRVGRRGALIVANLAVALVVVVAGGWAIFLPEGGLLSTTIELRVLSALAIAVVAVGTIGAVALPPPTADDHREEERRKRDEVGRIADEGHLAHGGDGV